MHVYISKMSVWKELELYADFFAAFTTLSVSMNDTDLLNIHSIFILLVNTSKQIFSNHHNSFIPHHLFWFNCINKLNGVDEFDSENKYTTECNGGFGINAT